MKLGVSIRNRKGKQVANKHKSTYSTLDPKGSPGCLRGWCDVDVDGTLVVEAT